MLRSQCSVSPCVLIRWFQEHRSNAPTTSSPVVGWFRQMETGATSDSAGDDNAIPGQTPTRRRHSLRRHGVVDSSEAVHSPTSLEFQLKGDHRPEAERET